MPYDNDTIEKVKKAIKAGRSQAEVEEDLDVGYSTYYRLKRDLRDAGELGADTVAADKRVARSSSAVPAVDDDDDGVQGGGQEEDQEKTQLRDRCLDLTEHVADLSMENMRLRRRMAEMQNAAPASDE